jgi:hypothetical protein
MENLVSASPPSSGGGGGGATGNGTLGRLTHTTAMCWAAAESDLEMMQRLLDHGADVNAGDYDKRCVRYPCM